MVVTVVVFIVSEKVTEIDDEIETEVSESEGEVDETVADVVSVVVVVLSVVVVVVPEFSVYSSLSSLQEMTVRLKNEIRIIYKIFFIFSLTPKVKYYGLVLGEPNK